MIHHDGRLAVTNYAITHVLLRAWWPYGAQELWYIDTGSEIVKPNLGSGPTHCYPTQSNMGQYFIQQNVEMGRVIH